MFDFLVCASLFLDYLLSFLSFIFTFSLFFYYTFLYSSLSSSNRNFYEFLVFAYSDSLGFISEMGMLNGLMGKFGR